jgi:hypothetical protein
LQTISGATIKTFDVSGLERFQLPENLGHQGLTIVNLQGKNVAHAAKVVNLIR